MLSKLNPIDVIKSHFHSLRYHDTEKISKSEVLFHLFFPAIIAWIYYHYDLKLNPEIVGIIVSAASIVAGLMLNLMVLIYTLAYNTKNAQKPISNEAEFKILTSEILASIAYSVLLCICLVVTAFAALASIPIIGIISSIITIYIGISILIVLLMILKRCYIIVNYDLNN